MSPSRPALREPLNLRIKADDRELIDRAAKSLGKTRTDFVIDAARQAAQEALLDQTNIVVDAKTYAAFLAILDAPPEPNERLRRTMTTRPRWEKPSA